ncbi:MAG TPA: enoyl-CoA hydratase-related protein [Jatrophihabitans sp.]
MSEVVRYEVANSVAWLTIDRPDARNALNADVRDGLWTGLRRFNEDDTAKVLVLTATGDKAFCAGGDLKEFADSNLRVPPSDFMPQFGRNIEVSKPTIAAVNGVAFAGGFLLTQNCDLVIAAENAQFAVTEVKVGRGSPWAVPLPWLVAPRVALEMVITGDPISAERAYQLGLVNRVVPLADLHDAAQELAERIAALAPLSVAAARRTSYLMTRNYFAEEFAEADRIWEPVYNSNDAQEGPASFRDKRKPNWTGT